ncbi:MAG TPA: VOC family protein [Pseudonocardiaceae bacterium]|nr:VOC family protein [Pseudonocardiaceae bacterium]
MSTQSEALATLAMIGVDCPDPRGLAEFYSQVLGWEIAGSSAEYAMIQGLGTPIVFWRSEGYEPPRWPEQGSAKRFHLDLTVDDLDLAEARCLELGATKAEHQPGAHWRVLLDPAGHPFCITKPE